MTNYYLHMRLSKKRKRILLKGIIFLFGIAFLFLVYFFFTYSKLYITEITVNDKAYQNRVVSTITEEFNRKWLYILPSRHILFVPRSRIEKQILLEYPEIKIVLLSREGLQKIGVTLTLRTPTLRLEDGLTLDEDGVVYNEKNDTSNLPLFTFVNNFPSKEEVHRINAFASQLSVRLSAIEGIEIDAEKDVRYYFGDHSRYVIAKLSSDSVALWSTLLSALDTNPLASLLQTRLNQLEYIDLRFGNKVFYKFTKTDSKKETLQATTTESAAN